MADYELDVGYVRILSFAQLFVMKELGWDRNAGLNLRLHPFADAPDAYAAVTEGAVALIYSGFSPAIKHANSGGFLEIIAPSSMNTSCLVSRGVFSELATQQEIPDAVRTFHAQTGRNLVIGTLSKDSVSYKSLVSLIEQLLPEERDLIEVRNVPERRLEEMLRAGEVDCALTKEPVISLCRESDSSVEVLLPAVHLPFYGATGGVSLVQRIEPEIVRRFVSLHCRATEFLRERGAEAAEFLGRYLSPSGEYSVSALREAMRNVGPQFVSEPKLLGEGLSELGRFMQKSGEIGMEFDVAAVVNLRYFAAGSEVKTGTTGNRDRPAHPQP